MTAPAQLAFWQASAGTPLDERYARWRLTEDGQAVFAAIEAMALKLVEQGDERIEINLLFASLRRQRQKACNNSFRSLIARELIHRHPALKGRIEVRKRKQEGAA